MVIHTHKMWGFGALDTPKCDINVTPKVTSLHGNMSHNI